MKPNVVVCHYDEIALKGNNRSKYEAKLISTIRTVLSRTLTGEEYTVSRMLGRVIVSFPNEIKAATEKKIHTTLLDVFGISHFAFAVRVKADLEIINETSLTLLNSTPSESFRVTAKRSDKSFPHTSPEIQQLVGAYLFEHTKKKVDLHTADTTCYVNIVDGYALIYTKKIEGPRGLPVGMSGHILTSLSGGIDSPVASHMLQKRGAQISCVHFHVYPYTSKASIEKVRELAQTLARFQNSITLHLVPFADIQNIIAASCPQKLRIILYRRMMLRISQTLAEQKKARGLATGEALAQVASQTLENLAATNEAVTMPILRPLIGFDKIEIMERAKKIGTYDISIRPHDDACERFVPDHPETQAKLVEVLKAEEELDIPAMIADALAKNETEVLMYDRQQ